MRFSVGLVFMAESSRTKRSVNAPPPIVLIRWIDSCEKLGWDFVGEMGHLDLECVSAGFLVKDTPEAITIVHSITGWGTEDYAGTGQMTIPKSAVKNVDRIG